MEDSAGHHINMVYQELRLTEDAERKLAHEVERPPDPCPLNPDASAHHWILDEKSHGVCQYCKKEKEFMGHVATSWNNTEPYSW